MAKYAARQMASTTKTIRIIQSIGRYFRVNIR